MQLWRRAGLLLVVLVPLTAHSASLSGSSSTVLEWFDTSAGDTAIGAYRYLRVNARELPGPA